MLLYYYFMSWFFWPKYSDLKKIKEPVLITVKSPFHSIENRVRKLTPDGGCRFSFKPNNKNPKLYSCFAYGYENLNQVVDRMQKYDGRILFITKVEPFKEIIENDAI